MTSRITLTLLAAITLSALGAGTAYAGFEQVPEPSSLALLATGVGGIAGLAWWLRRK